MMTSLDNSLIYVFIHHNTFYLKYLYVKRRETILLISLIRNFQTFDKFYLCITIQALSWNRMKLLIFVQKTFEKHQ